MSRGEWQSLRLQGLGSLLADWNDLVEDLEQGFHWGGPEEFIHCHLNVRESLADAHASLRGRDRHWLMRQLVPLDRRFTAATQDSARKRRRGRVRRRWWRGRWPISLVTMVPRQRPLDSHYDPDWPADGTRVYVPMRPVSLVWPHPGGSTTRSYALSTDTSGGRGG